MPPKRKALAEKADNGNSATTARGTKASKKSSKATAPECSKGKTPTEPDNSKKQSYKYCNANTVSKNKPKYANLQWPNISDFIDDKDQDMPKDGELIDPYCNRISDLGFPISDEGGKLLDKLDKEQGIRDQDRRNLFIYNDWNGWGLSEVMVNYLNDFNRDIFKKTISPYKKWAYVEALATFLKHGANLMEWLGNENGPAVGEIIDMLGVMTLTCFDMLAEHNLLKPDSDIKTIVSSSLLLLEFLEECQDWPIEWGTEVVRLCDEAGIDLDKEIRKQVSFSKERLKELREKYMEKKQSSEFGKDYDGNGYLYFANKKDWKRADDIIAESRDAEFPGREEKMWYRWDWELEFTKNKRFRENHPGGKHYVLTKRTPARATRLGPA